MENDMNLIPRPLKSLFVNYLEKRLPSRTKRLIFLASLSAKVTTEGDQFDPETLRKINSLLRICGSEKAMNLPIHLNEVIWNNEVVCDVEKLMALDGKEEQEELVQSFVQSVMAVMPKWLKYGRQGDTQKDLETLFRNSKFVFGTA